MSEEMTEGIVEEEVAIDLDEIAKKYEARLKKPEDKK